MADTKITALSALTAADPANDVLPIVDVNDPFMAASGTTKKISINNILGASGTATLASATISGDLTVDTSTLKVDSANNWVGVGTATPAVRLHSNVADAAEAARFSSTSALLRFHPYVDATDKTRIQATNATNTGLSDLTLEGLNLRFNTNGGLAYAISNTGVATWSNVGGVAGTAMTLNATGLGVGVASPAFKLDVLGSATISGRFRTSGALNALYLEDSGTTAGSLYIGTSGDTFRIITGSNVRMNVDVNGNVGIGVTPSAWGSAYKTISNLLYADYYSNNGGIIGISGNAYNNGTSWIYKNTTAAHRYEQSIGSGHIWFNAPSGTSGTAITFTQAMTLDASGNLLVGTTATAGSASNSTKTVGGIFSSVNGTSASTASGSAVTLFASQSEATYMVSAYVFGTGAPATYNAVAIVKTNAGVATITTISSATNLTISISGLNVQVTQTSGVSQVITYNVIRIS